MIGEWLKAFNYMDVKIRSGTDFKLRLNTSTSANFRPPEACRGENYRT